MAGYGGQLVALDVQPFDLASPLAKAANLRAADTAEELGQSQLKLSKIQQERDITALNEQQAKSPLEIAAAQRKEDLDQQQYRSTLIANAAARANSADDWDAAFTKLRDKGVDEAGQFIGRYTPLLQGRVAAAYGGQQAAGSESALIGAASPGVVAGPAGKGAPAGQNYDQMFANVPLPAMAQSLQRLEAIKSALQTVKDPQSWDAAVTRLDEAGVYPGAKQYLGQYSPLRVQQLWSEIAPVDDYLQRRVLAASTGQPEPVVTPIQKEVDGILYNIDPRTGAATPVTSKIVMRNTATGGQEINLVGPGGAGASGGAEGSTPAQTPVPKGAVFDKIDGYAKSAGATPEEAAYLKRTAQLESGGKLDARNGSSTGAFQFHPSTFAALGGKNINDLGEQTAAALKLARQDKQALQKIGIEPTDADLYILHQQGVGGGAALLTAPRDINAIAALEPVYGSEDMARKAVVGNGGKPDMTVGDFTDMIRAKWNGAKVPAGQGSTQNAGAIGGLTVRTLVKDADENDLSPQSIDYLAQRYLTGEPLPAMGNGKMATRNRDAILNRASEIEAETGRSGTDAAAAHAVYKSATAALGQVAKQEAMMLSFEATARKNGELALSLAAKGAGPTGSPLFNRWVQAGRKKLAGDADVTAFDNALDAYATEVAKIKSGSLGNTPVAESEIREVRHNLFDRAGTLGQLQAAMAVGNTEMENRRQSIADERERQLAIIRNRGVLPGQSPGTGATGTVQTPGQTPGAASPAGRGAVGQDPQLIAAQQFRGSKAPAGSAQNPWMTKTEAQYNRLPSGSYYIFTDGTIHRKP